MNALAEKIIKTKNLKDIKYVSMLFDIARNDHDLSLLRKVIAICRKNIKLSQGTQQALEFHKLYRAALLEAAPYDFDSFLIYVELERPPQERFYIPRRKILYKAVKAMQALADNELDELFCPCRRELEKQRWFYSSLHG